VFTARYALSPYIKQIHFVFKRLILWGKLLFVFLLQDLTCLLLHKIFVNNSIAEGPFWEADSCWAGQGIPRLVWNSKSMLPCLRHPATGSYSEPGVSVGSVLVSSHLSVHSGLCSPVFPARVTVPCVLRSLLWPLIFSLLPAAQGCLSMPRPVSLALYKNVPYKTCNSVNSLPPLGMPSPQEQQSPSGACSV
jgi:hypothetical protein